MSTVDQIVIAEPCSVSWDSMCGDERRRFCDGCGKHVYNLIELTKRETENLFAAHARAKPCVRICQRTDGTVVFADAPEAVKKRVVHLRMLAATALSLASAACATSSEDVDTVRTARTGTQLSAFYAEEKHELAAPPGDESKESSELTPVNKRQRHPSPMMGIMF